MTDEENKQLTKEVWMVHNIYGRGYKDAIDEFMRKLCDTCIQSPNECSNSECPFANDGCQIIKIAEQLKEGAENG